MIRTTFIASAAALAVAVSTPAVAGPGGGHGGGPGAGAAGQMGGMQGAAGAGGMSSPGATVRADARVNSQGAANANQHALDNANANSALGSSTTTTTTAPLTGTRIRPENRMSGNVSTHANTTLSAHGQLTGVTTGMNVLDTNGTAIGTVTGIRTVGNGSAKTVQVTLTDGTIVTLDANSLTLTDGVLTTSSLTSTVNSQGAAHANINGLIHASPRSALATAGVTTLTGLSTGLTVNNLAGDSIGTVSGIVTNRSGAVVGIRVDLTGGGTVLLPATSLSMSGTTVVTSSTTTGT